MAPVMPLTDPKQVWEVQKNQYNTVSQASRDALLERYQEMKM